MKLSELEKKKKFHKKKFKFYSKKIKEINDTNSQIGFKYSKRQ
jgi:hypothetical protein